MKQIEEWISESLNPDKSDLKRVNSTLIEYQIDRLSLSKQNLSADQIDRLYRALYVCTCSFFQTLQATINTPETLQRVWLVLQ